METKRRAGGLTRHARLLAAVIVCAATSVGVARGQQPREFSEETVGAERYHRAMDGAGRPAVSREWLAQWKAEGFRPAALSALLEQKRAAAAPAPIAASHVGRYLAAADYTFRIGPKDQGYDYEKIEEAIDEGFRLWKLAPGYPDVKILVEIIVSPGTYYENLTLRGYEIILRSTDPNSPEVVAGTIVNGIVSDPDAPPNSNPVIICSGMESPVSLLAGLTITGGASENGGGIFGNRTQMTIENNIISDNYALLGGGGISDCDGTIQNNTIVRNQAHWGGGIDYCNGTISSNTIVYNEAGVGGGIGESYGTIIGNLIANNLVDGRAHYLDHTPGGSGGGISSCPGLVAYNTIRNNKAKYGGGAYWCTNLFANTISDNTASADGGGVYSGFTGCLLQDNFIAQNKASGNGGGMSVLDGCFLFNNTICTNTATNGGGLSGGGWPEDRKNDCRCPGDDLPGPYNLTATHETPIVYNNVISGNLASGDGGGLYELSACRHKNEDRHGKGSDFYTAGIFIFGNTIAANGAVGDGGGLYCCNGINWKEGSGKTAEWQLIFSEIRSNRILNNATPNNGGGLYNCDLANIVDNIVAFNYATKSGGGMSQCGSPQWNDRIHNSGEKTDPYWFYYTIVYGNTVWGNTCDTLYGGGGIYAGGALWYANVIWDNVAPVPPDGPSLANFYYPGFQLAPNYCCIKGYAGYGTGNIVTPPDLVDPKNYDFRLRAVSSCIDKAPMLAAFYPRSDDGLVVSGELYSAYPLTTIDIEGRLRPVDGNGLVDIDPYGVSIEVDIGAYEYQQQIPVISGRVETPDHRGIPDVQIVTDDDVNSATTDMMGNYYLMVPFRWRGAIAPRLDGYVFLPPSRPYPDEVIEDQPGQNYIGYPTPSNDNFVSATLVAGDTGIVDGWNYGATREPGEPDHAGTQGGASVWWAWSNPVSGMVAFNTKGSNFDTVLAAYTGSSVSDLMEIASNDDVATPTSEVTFHATRGTTYAVAVDSAAATTQGVITLNWSFQPSPPNDDFENAYTIGGEMGHTTGTTARATRQDGEPIHAGVIGGVSVWWTWTCPTAGSYWLDTNGSGIDTLLAVYTGSSLSNLAYVASDDNGGYSGASRLQFDAVAGTTYTIAVDAWNREQGSVRINWTIVETITPPGAPSGSQRGIRGLSYTFSSGGAVSDLGHPLEYRFDWGDGNVSNWDTTTTLAHVWADAGLYQVKAQARCATHTETVSDWSPALTVKIIKAIDSDRVSNISTRGIVGSGADVMIAGFIIEGAQSKKVLVTGWGPSLKVYGVPNVLADPTLTLFKGESSLATNDNWIYSPSAAGIIATGHQPSSSFESAILMTMPPGAYTAVVSGVGGTTGNGLVAVWDVGDDLSLVTNISTRGYVGSGDNSMIAGFIVQGETPLKIAVTGWGPTLTAMGVPNALADPALRIYSGATELAANDNWGDAPNKADLETAGLAPAFDAEAAVLLTLAPGAYTAVLSGADGGVGNGLVAVWLVR